MPHVDFGKKMASLKIIKNVSRRFLDRRKVTKIILFGKKVCAERSLPTVFFFIKSIISLLFEMILKNG